MTRLLFVDDRWETQPRLTPKTEEHKIEKWNLNICYDLFSLHLEIEITGTAVQQLERLVAV